MTSRSQFEIKFPVPAGVTWNPETLRYVLTELRQSTVATYEAHVERWVVWQACRDSLAVAMPPVPKVPEPPEDAIDDSFLDGHCAVIRMRNACYLAIEAAGVKVKS
jgi:hypothetical protein